MLTQHTHIAFTKLWGQGRGGLSNILLLQGKKHLPLRPWGWTQHCSLWGRRSHSEHCQLQLLQTCKHLNTFSEELQKWQWSLLLKFLWEGSGFQYCPRKGMVTGFAPYKKEAGFPFSAHLSQTFSVSLWSNGQSCWLQIQRSRFDSRQYQVFWVVCLQWGPLSLVFTAEGLLERSSSSSGLKKSWLWL
jgi:hypothetical protein